MTMHRSFREGLVSGLILGVLIAFGFALLIRLIPADLLVNTLSRAVLYTIQVPASVNLRSYRQGRRTDPGRECTAGPALGDPLALWPSTVSRSGSGRRSTARRELLRPSSPRCCCGRSRGS